jgi:diadenylate cyclase
LVSVLAAQFHLLALDWVLSSSRALSPHCFRRDFSARPYAALISQIGRGGFWGGVFPGATRFCLKSISGTVQSLVKSKRGAIIVIEREDSLQGILDSGTKMEAEVTAELLVTLFVPSLSVA